MSAKRAKTLVFHRAIFSKDFSGQLEELVRLAFARNQSPRDRIIPIDLVSNLAFASTKDVEGGGIFLRLLDFETGATGVINFDTNDVDSIVEAFDHPDNKSFLKDQYFLLIRDNSIISCGIGNKAGTFSRCVVELCQKAGILIDGVSARLADMPDQITVARIREVGVKKLDFSLVGLMGELNADFSQAAGARVMQMIFGIPSSNRLSVQKRANAIGRLSLSRGKFEKSEVEKDDWISEIAAEIIEAGSVDQYKIVLEDDSIVKNSSLKRSKKVMLSRHANSVTFQSAFLEMCNFRDELIQSGELDA